MSNTTHVTVTVKKVNEFEHKEPIITRLLISNINKVVANGSEAILFTKGLYGAKTFEVSESKAVIDDAINGGFLDGSISLSVTAIDNVTQDSTATSFLISSIIDYVVNVDGLGGSTLRTRSFPTKKDVFIDVTESVTTMDALLPIALVSGANNIETDMTATGVDNTDAAVITETTTIIDAGAASTGAILPQVAAGDRYVVINNTASRKLIYPFLLDRIDTLTPSTEGYILEPQASVTFYGGAALTWESNTEVVGTDEVFTDTITEKTAAAGVTADGVLLKDGNVELIGATNNAIIAGADQANQANTYTIPDADADASFVMTEGAQTINGAKTLSGIQYITNNTDSSGGDNGSFHTDGGIGAQKNINSGGSIKSNSATGGIGYGLGAGGSVAQATSRTTTVVTNTASGEITLFSEAGSATPQTFTVTNSAVAATDTINVSQKSGTDLYHVLVTAVAAGSFNITVFTTGGTTSEAPVINFTLFKGVTS